MMTGWNINAELPRELRDIKSRVAPTILASRRRDVPVFPYKTCHRWPSPSFGPTSSASDSRSSLRLRICPLDRPNRLNRAFFLHFRDDGNGVSFLLLFFSLIGDLGKLNSVIGPSRTYNAHVLRIGGTLCSLEYTFV